MPSKTGKICVDCGAVLKEGDQGLYTGLRNFLPVCASCRAKRKSKP